MKKKSIIIRIILLAFIIAGCGYLYFNAFKVNKGIRVTSWNNIYNENNLTFFYEDLGEPSSNIKKLDKLCKISELAKECKDEISKISKSLEILHTIVEYDDVENSMGNNGYAILEEKGLNKKVSNKDLAIIERDILISLGFNARVGEFRKEEPQFQKKPSYYVVEYFSTEKNKWIMIDVIDKGYMEKDGTMLSAIEIIGEKLSDITYVGNSTQNEYRKKIAPYTTSYTVAIDNTIKNGKSNTSLTYVSSEKNIDIVVNNEYIPSTIFTEEKKLFLQAPTFLSETKDGETYLVMMRKPLDTSENLTFVVGAFTSGSTIEKYYLKVNDGIYKEIERYEEVILKEGNNTIELSIDGENCSKKIEIYIDK